MGLDEYLASLDEAEGKHYAALALQESMAAHYALVDSTA